VTDLSQILQNLESILNPLAVLLVAVSFISGVFMVYKGISELKQFGQSQNQMSRPGELAGPMVHLMVGAILIYLPTTTDIISTSIFYDAGRTVFDGNRVNIALAGSDSAELLSYSGGMPLEQKWQEVMTTIFHYVQFIGFVAFVRGWFILSKIGAQGGQPGNAAKGLIHVLGGIIAINVIPALEILRNTVLG
jgi:intracellular multiplication protein IcmC